MGVLDTSAFTAQLSPSKFFPLALLLFGCADPPLPSVGDATTGSEGNADGERDPSGSTGEESTGVLCEGDAATTCVCEDGEQGQRLCEDSGLFGECDCTYRCGDGVVEGPESCDDGNLESGDGCDGRCRFESGTTVFELVIDIGDWELTTDGKIAVYQDDVLSFYDSTGRQLTRTNVPPWRDEAFDPPTLTPAPSGNVLLANNDCRAAIHDQYINCDRWRMYDAEGELLWEHRFEDDPEPLFRPLTVGVLEDGFLAVGEPFELARYASDGNLLWRADSGRHRPEWSTPTFLGQTAAGDAMLRLQLGSLGTQLLTYDIATGAETSAQLHPESLLTVVVSEERIYTITNDPGVDRFRLRAFDSAEVELWSVQPTLSSANGVGLAVLKDQRIVVGAVPDSLDPELTNLLVLSPDAELVAIHIVERLWPLKIRVGPNGFIYASIYDGTPGARFRLIGFAP